MNRNLNAVAGIITGVPRASGDEPAVLDATITTDMCSPRQRG